MVNGNGNGNDNGMGGHMGLSLGLGEDEVHVLRDSSVINGRVYQPWLEGEQYSECFRFDRPFCDPDGLLPLSKSQKEAGATYVRPVQLLQTYGTARLRDTGTYAGSSGTSEAIITKVSMVASSPSSPSFAPGISDKADKAKSVSAHTNATSQPQPYSALPDGLTITQEMVGDCSFVCSLVLAALYVLNVILLIY